MFNPSNLKGPVYIAASFALPLIVSYNIYNFSGLTSLTAWCFFMFAAVHMVYGELSRRYDTMDNVKTGIATDKELFWLYMMVGANITHFGVLAFIHFFADQWQFPLNPDGSIWSNVNGVIKIFVIFSLIKFAWKPSIIQGQGPVIDYGERGYWKITKHPVMAQMLVLCSLYFLQRMELTNINLWLVGFLAIGLIHQNNRKSKVLKDKPGLDLRKFPIAFYEEFFQKPKEDCFISPKFDLLTVIVVSAIVWLGNDHSFLFLMWGVVTLMSFFGSWYAFGFNVSNENYQNYLAKSLPHNLENEERNLEKSSKPEIAS